LDLIRLYIATG
jgi:hypothetical protein